MPKFSEHEKSKYWNYEKNDKNPEDFTYGSGKKAWFNCNKCKHTFECSIGNITNGRWCSYCSVPPKKLCIDNNCKECYNKSFASHEKSKYWSKDNIVKPRDVFRSANKKYLFDCVCKHQFSITLNDVSNGYF
jgi:hypothetical protein